MKWQEIAVEDGKAYPENRWYVLSVACLAIMSCYTNIVAYAPLIGHIARDFKIDIGTAMHLVSTTYIVTAVALFFAGLVCDRYGTRAALVLGLLFSVVPMLFVPFIRSFTALILVRVIQGIAPAFAMVIVGPITGLWFPKRQQGLASGLMMGSLSLGAAVGLVASPIIWKLTGSWQLGVSILSIPGWLGIVLSICIRGKTPDITAVPATPPEGDSAELSTLFRNALSSRVTWLGAAVFFFSAWGMHSLYALVPAYLSAPSPMGVGLEPVLSGQLSLALTLVGIFAVLAGGVFLDKVAGGNFRLVLAAGFTLSALFSYLILLPSVYGGLFFLTVCLLGAGWGIPFTSPSMIALVIGAYPLSIVARMLGLLGGLATFGGAAGVYLGGLAVAKTGRFHHAILIIALSSLAGLVVTCFLKPKSAHTPTGV
jgi:predicted MFS family arabinose efflux permease